VLGVLLLLFTKATLKKNNNDTLRMSSSSPSSLAECTTIRKINVVGVVVLLLFTCKLHKDNDALGIIIILFAKMHYTPKIK
jgi:hypothetical protein